MEQDACRLYLVAPDPLPDRFAALLEEALAAGDVAAVRLCGADEDAARGAVAGLRPVAVAHGVALILAGNPALAAAMKCDGVHLSDPEGARSARGLLGDLQLGVFCGLSRDAAMQAGESGADYVAFGPFSAASSDEELDVLSWWSDLMELPVVADGDITVANSARLVRAGADFLAVRDAVWNDPAGPAAAVRALNAVIAAA